MDKLTLQARIDELQAQLGAAKMKEETEYKYRKLLIDAGLKLTEIEANTNTDQDENFEENMEAVSESN